MDSAQLKPIISDQLKEFLSPHELMERDAHIIQHLNQPEITVITGVRRCGKSTLMNLIAQQALAEAAICYLDLDDARLFDFSVADFQRAFSAWLELQPSTPTRIFFFYDEIQNVHGWERWVTQLAKNPQYKVIITGSNSKVLSSDLASHLTGRYMPIELWPLSFHEVLTHAYGATVEDKAWRASTLGNAEIARTLEQYLTWGGFPRCYVAHSTHLLPIYYRDIVERDILHRHKVRSPKVIFTLGKFLMSDNTRLFNKSKIATTIGVGKQATISTYCHYFEETFIVSELKAFHYSIRKQTRSLSKFYAVDPVLAMKVGFGFSPNDGVILENLVYIELRRRGYEVYYWHSSRGLEVDFVTVRGTKIDRAIQTCYSLSAPPTLERELRALRAAKVELHAQQFFLITMRDDARVLEEDGITVQIVPFAEWASTT